MSLRDNPLGELRVPLTWTAGIVFIVFMIASVAILLSDRREAFDTLLGEGRPAFVPRTGATVAEVATIVRAAGGIASLAHPGLTKVDDAIPAFVAGGLPAIEVWHSDHDQEATARYKRCAEVLGLGTSGGSDYHAEHSHHAAGRHDMTCAGSAQGAADPTDFAAFLRYAFRSGLAGDDAHANLGFRCAY